MHSGPQGLCDVGGGQNFWILNLKKIISNRDNNWKLTPFWSNFVCYVCPFERTHFLLPHTVLSLASVTPLRIATPYSVFMVIMRILFRFLFFFVAPATSYWWHFGGTQISFSCWPASQPNTSSVCKSIWLTKVAVVVSLGAVVWFF